MFHLSIATLFTYIFVYKFGRKKSAFWVFGFTMVYLASMHIYRMITNYEKWDIRDPTGIYMLSMCKFSFFAFSYEDGEKEDKDIYNPHHRSHKIVNLPSFFEYLSYIYFFPTSTYGPSIEYTDFIDYIYLKKQYANMSTKKNILLGFLRVLIAFVIIGFYGAFNSSFPPQFIGSEEFGSSNFLYKFIYVNLSSIFTKAKYYGGWTLTYGILIMGGVSYTEEEVENKETKKKEIKPSYQIGYIGSIIEIETSSNTRNIIVQWNHPCHLWLKYCLFLRLIYVKKFNFYRNYHLSSLVTFISSSFWHGFYPCYYVFFISFFFIQQASENLIKLGFYDWLHKQNIIIRGLVAVLVQYIINGLAIVFFAMKYKIIKMYLINTYGFPVFIVLFIYLISLLCLISSSKEDKEKKKI